MQTDIVKCEVLALRNIVKIQPENNDWSCRNVPSLLIPRADRPWGTAFSAGPRSRGAGLGLGLGGTGQTMCILSPPDIWGNVQRWTTGEGCWSGNGVLAYGYNSWCWRWERKQREFAARGTCRLDAGAPGALLPARVCAIPTLSI